MMHEVWTVSKKVEVVSFYENLFGVLHLSSDFVFRFTRNRILRHRGDVVLS